MSDYSIFSVLGIEIEYMLVDKQNLSIKAASDKILEAMAGHQVEEVAIGDIAWSNELVLHVLELKNNGPQRLDVPVAAHFQTALLEIQSILARYDVLLLPTGAHPWMNPHLDTVRWPHGNKDIYNQYDKIFDCRGHGWSNLQSMHVNLPFANSDEFYRLHSLVRLILPLIPAISASTPILDGKVTGFLDSRLVYYCENQKKIPLISGQIIPEFIASEQAYHDQILNPMYQAILPYDPEGILHYEWLNSRGAIAKFDMNAIEIRVIDSQECVHADLAVAKAIHYILNYWHDASEYYIENPCDTMLLKAVFDHSVKAGFATHIDNKELLRQWGLSSKDTTLQGVWSLLLERIAHNLNQQEQKALDTILTQGNLSQRILKAIKKQNLTEVYRQLTDSLLNDQQFIDYD